jgi:hypothetical protein
MHLLIGHALGRGVTRLVAQLLLALLDFLLLLDEGAAAAAARCQAVRHEVALQVVLVADVGALHEHGDDVQTEAARRPEAQALIVISLASDRFRYPIWRSNLQWR